MGNILVIGNGFDLAHGRKTAYSHFIKYILNSDPGLKSLPEKYQVNKLCSEFMHTSLYSHFVACQKANVTFQSWVDIEKELQQYIKRIESTIDFINNNPKLNPREAINHVSGLDWDLLKTMTSVCELEMMDIHFKKKFLDGMGQIDKNRVFNAIESDLKVLSETFTKYLMEVEPKLRSDCKSIERIKEINPQYVISFNYTETMQEVYGLQCDQICYIHGNVKKNNVVFGYDDSDEREED